MKWVRIFLFVLILIGLGLIFTQKAWVPKLVDRLIKHEKSVIETPIPQVKDSKGDGNVKNQNGQCPVGTWADADTCLSLGTTTPEDIISYPVAITTKKDFLKNSFLLGSTSVSIDSSKINLLPAFSFKSITFSQTSNEYSQQTWSHFGDFTFHFDNGSIEIYKRGVSIDEIKSYEWTLRSGNFFDTATFLFNNRYYFIFGGTNCGNGGCEDNSVVYSIGFSENKGKSESIWQHSWTWGHGGQPITGFQGDEQFDSAIEYNGHLFLFSNASSSVKMDKDGNVIKGE